MFLIYEILLELYSRIQSVHAAVHSKKISRPFKIPYALYNKCHLPIDKSDFLKNVLTINIHI